MQQPLKRKTPSGTSPAPLGSNAGYRPGVKAEPADYDPKRQRQNYSSHAGPSRPTSSRPTPVASDPRTAAASMASHLKANGTLGWEEAWFHIQSEYPGHDAQKVLELLKKLERVEFNELNQVFTWVPELTLANEAQVRTYIRTNSTATQGVVIRNIKEALPPNGLSMIEDLERRGDVLIMRGLTGSFKDAALPPLGRRNVHGLKINDPGTSGGQRLRTVWWDDVRERGRAGTRLEDEFVFSWDEVKIAETDDIIKLLEREHLGASSTMPAAPKVTASAQQKKKKKTRRALKITNVHMKEQGIDFSQDYEAPT